MTPTASLPISVPVAADLGSAIKEPVASHATSALAVAQRSHVLHRDLSSVPLIATRAKGCYLYTSDGAKLLDACGGAAVVSIGHGDDRVVDALAEQMRTVGYCHSGLWSNTAAEQLAELLCKEAGMERCLFANGGSEAVETALKLARQHFVEAGQPQRVNFIARDQSYHGNLFGSLALSGHKMRKAIYTPLLSTHFHHVSPCFPYRHKKADETDEAYVERLRDELEEKFKQLGPDTVAAFVCETVGGATAGCVVPVPGYLQAMRQVCDKYGALLIFDEVMCGMGRVGTMHAWQSFGVKPDIQTAAKGLTGGYAPCSAILASSSVLAPLDKGTGRFVNGFTFQSWSIGARAALEVQRIIKSDGLLQRCRDMGKLLRSELEEKLDGAAYVGDVRGMGLFQAVEFVLDARTKATFPSSLHLSEQVMEECVRRGLVVYPGGGTADGFTGDHILIAPPFIIDEEQVRFIARTLREACDAVVEPRRRECVAAAAEAK